MKKSEKKGATILIVDDKQSNIFSLEQLLENKERTFLSATNGTEGLKIALNKTLDLIILDVQMPDMDGFEVAQILQSNKKTKDIPIIFASAEKKEHASIIKGFDEGAIDYLFKPLDPEVTKAKVSALLKAQLQKKELREKNISLEKSALLINNSVDIIGIIDPATLKFEEVNVAFGTILGYPLEEAKGNHLTFFLHPEEREMIVGLTASTKEKLSFESRIYCKDRTIKWLHWHVTVRDKKWFINARDITEVKQVERIRNYVAAIVKQSGDAIYIHDQEGRIISWNEGAERIYGYTENEALNMKIWNIIPEYLLPETQAIVGEVLAGGKVINRETKRITKRGKIVDVLFSASVIIDSNDQRKSIAITERDVTQQKISEEKILQLNTDLQRNVAQLQVSNQELESFSYSVSHDLRAPLRAIHGNAKIIEEDHKDLGEDARLLIHRIQHNAEKMGQLIDDLLAFSRIGKAEIRKAETDMAALVERSLTELNESVKHKAQISILSLPSAYGDHSLLGQVWINLISNAVKYSAKKKNPKVEIGSIKEENTVVYYVKDNGAGFDMTYANKLFGTFQRLHGSTEFEGTGIGLAIANRIVSKHEGKIWAEAQLGVGATFFFTIGNAPTPS